MKPEKKKNGQQVYKIITWTVVGNTTSNDCLLITLLKKYNYLLVSK